MRAVESMASMRSLFYSDATKKSLTETAAGSQTTEHDDMKVICALLVSAGTTEC